MSERQTRRGALVRLARVSCWCLVVCSFVVGCSNGIIRPATQPRAASPLQRQPNAQEPARLQSGSQFTRLPPIANNAPSATRGDIVLASATTRAPNEPPPREDVPAPKPMLQLSERLKIPSEL